ncbi:MAG TPA: hypothetical protein ENN99_03750 [Chloroflexi bacterium]|nr:hypothetical protein [Chloroflexota bacterium]
MDERIAQAIQKRTPEGMLGCAAAFRIAEDLGVTPRAVGQTADELNVRLTGCQLRLFGHGDQKGVQPAEEVAPEVAQAIQEGLILGRLPCAVAWAIAVRFGMPKSEVANAAETLGVRIAQCQIGAF